MPKMKTHRGAAKRFHHTGSGKLRRNRAFHRHLLAHKSSRRKRRLRQKALVSPGDAPRIRRLLPGA
ncbi:MAG: 50S ribosomal protein L35 [Clostridia bacterium]|nr:50S ribosomal protein L35 [Clostridia bacterium]